MASKKSATPDQARRRRERDRVNQARSRARAAGRDPDEIPGLEPPLRRVVLPGISRPADRLAEPGRLPDLAAGMVRRRIR